MNVKSTFKLFLALMFIALVAVAYQQHKTLNTAKTEITRLSDNLANVNQENENWITKSGKQVQTIQELELTQTELVRIRSQDQELINNLGIKLNRLQSILKIKSNQEIIKVLPAKDTILVRDSIDVDTCKTFHFSDKYVTIKGLLCDSAKIDILHRDSILIVAHRIPYKFLFLRFGTKNVRMDVTSQSPYSKIVYSEFIKLKR